MRIINTFPRGVDFSSLRVLFWERNVCLDFPWPVSEQEDHLLRSVLTSCSYDLPEGLTAALKQDRIKKKKKAQRLLSFPT